MSDSSLPLHKAIVAALKADAGVAAIVAGRVYDSVTSGASKPYITLGPFDALTEIATNYDGADNTVQVDGWSSGPATVQAKQIGRAIHAALHEQDLALEDNQRLVSLEVEQVRYLREPDGLTSHVVVTVRARTEPIT